MSKSRVGRNDPCPCGSGQKYKKCHGSSGAASALTPPSGQYQSVGSVVAPLPSSAEDDITSPIKKTDGSTPSWLKRLIEDGVRDVFDRQLRECRGDLCLYISVSVARLLKAYKIGARVAVGSATWENYPHCFVWKGREEFHAWVETEFDELVDLGCDAFHQRRGLTSRAPPGPASCWNKREHVQDRKYVEVPGGAIAVGAYAADEAHLKDAPNLMKQFVQTNEKRYRQEHGE